MECLQLYPITTSSSDGSWTCLIHLDVSSSAESLRGIATDVHGLSSHSGSQPTHGAPTRDEAPAAVPGSLANIDSNSVPPSPPATADEATASPVAAATSAEAVLAAHEALNARLMTLHAALPPLTALIVFTGHGDPRLMAALASKKARFDRLWKTTKQSEIRNEDRWMESDDRNLVDEVEKCRVGLSFYAVK